jgi:alpha-beta hydrolase superfamily lysophospholipase
VEKKKKFKEPLLQRLIRTGFPWLERVAPTLANRLFVYIFFTPFRHQAPEKEEVCARGAAITFLNYRGRKVAVYEWGEGDRCVWVVHGWAGRATQFRKMIPALNKVGYRVIGFDGPGHGRSGGKQTNAIEFREVMELLAKTYGTPVAIVGHSFGGAASLYAIANGLAVPKLIEIGSPVDRTAILRSYLKAINGSEARITFFDAYVLEKFGQQFDSFTTRHIIRQLKQPLSLLLVHDEDDRDVLISQPELLVRENPWVKFYRTKGLGHNRILRDETVIAYCIDFIRDRQD